MSHAGRAEVLRQRQKLTALFSAIDGASLNAELTAHYSRYLCVLVSGHAEQSVKELANHYCRKRSSPQVHRYSSGQLRRIRNIDLEKLRQLIEGFDTEWWRQISSDYPDELTAFGSVATVRNAISHGKDTGITMSTVRQYFEQISLVLDSLCDLFDPKGADSNQQRSEG